MNIHTHCPLCKNALDVEDELIYIYVRCKVCVYDDMPKFSATYLKDTSLTTADKSYENWWIGDYYFRLDFHDNVTSVSRIETCVLLDTVKISGILKMDYDNPENTLNRIRKLLIFS